MKMKELTDFYRDKRVLVTGHTGFKGGLALQDTGTCRGPGDGVFPGTAYGSQPV